MGTHGDLAPSISIGDEIVCVDEKYFRPAEVETLLGDPSLASLELGWTPKIGAREMCAEMVAEDLKMAKRAAVLSKNNLALPNPVEG